MVTDQKHLSNSTDIEQEVIRCIEKIAKLLGLKQDANMHSALSIENKILKKQLEDYHSQPNTLKRRVKKLEKDVRFLKIELGDLDECVGRETVVDLI